VINKTNNINHNISDFFDIFDFVKNESAFLANDLMRSIYK